MLVHSLPVKKRKRLAYDAFYTLVTHGGLVNDIADTDYLEQNGSTEGHVRDFQMSIHRKQDKELKAKLLHVFKKEKYSVPIHIKLVMLVYFSSSLRLWKRMATLKIFPMQA